MFDRPERADLLEAIASFLEGDLKGQISDPRLAFRTLIAAHLCRSIAAECRNGETLEKAELERLRALLPGKVGERALEKAASPSQRRPLLGELYRALIAKLRDRQTGEEARTAIQSHLVESLRAELSVTSPRFDLSPEIE